MWDSSINLWSRKHTNSDTVVGFENEMVSHAHARHARHSRVFTPEFGDSLDSRQLLQLRARPHSYVFCGIVSPKLTRVHGNATSQVLASRVHGNATCKFELPKLGKIYLTFHRVCAWMCVCVCVCFAGLLISLKSIINDCPKYLIFMQI